MIWVVTRVNDRIYNNYPYYNFIVVVWKSFEIGKAWKSKGECKVKERNREVHTLILTSTCTYIHQIKEPIRREGKWQKPFCFCFTELLSVIIQAFNGWSGVELIWVVWDK